MTDTILVSFVHARMLVDSGASHCFMLYVFIIQHTAPYVNLDLS